MVNLQGALIKVDLKIQPSS